MDNRDETLKWLSRIMMAVIVIVTGGGILLAIWDLDRGKMDMMPQEFVRPDWPSRDLKAGTPFTEGYDGIDISSHQGRIYWDSLRMSNPNLLFIYVRAVGKKGPDSNYMMNVCDAKQAGFAVGSYHFFNMATPVEEQFRMFSQMVNPEEQDILPMLDVEPQSLAPDDNEHFVDSVKKMLSLMEKAYKRKPVIYSNQHFYNQYLARYLAGYPLWIANYSSEPVIHGARPILWQCSMKGHVRGIWTDVDIDRFVNGASINDILL